jgi:2-dehydro-3-deoxygluconokinase
LQSPKLEATFGGAESNVAISLALLGLKSQFLTALPTNPIGQAAISFLNSFNVDTSFIVRKEGRMGIYFVETGSGPRGSMVLYDRADSVIANISPDAFDWNAIFADSQWFHITGITPALSESGAELTKVAMKAAKNAGLKISCDLNYRGKLWKWGKPAAEVMRDLMEFTEIIIANEEDIQMSLGIKSEDTVKGGELDREKYCALANQVFEEFPNVNIVAITLRESFSADHNDWSAMLCVRGEAECFFSRKYSLTDIVDRVGAGDSFGAGLIFGFINEMSYQESLEFAVAASALKHTIPGDINRVTLDEIKKVATGEGSGRVSR